MRPSKLAETKAEVENLGYEIVQTATGWNALFCGEERMFAKDFDTQEQVIVKAHERLFKQFDMIFS